MEKEYTGEQYDKDYELKQQGLEKILGKMHDMVGHSVVPFYMGGSVDLYYFLHHIKGTGFATMELLDIEGNGPLPNELGTYELLAFTKNYYDEGSDGGSAFNLIQSRICENLTAVGNYSYETVFDPGDTYESIFGDNDEERYMIFDHYAPGNTDFNVGKRRHYLLLCMEIFKREMEFSWDNGSDELIDLLKKKGYYPYSDLDREPVA